MKTREIRAAVAFAVIAFVGATVQADQIWDRSADWVPGTPGSISGQPGPSGTSPWVCEYTSAGGDLLSATPWFRTASTAMSWDTNWWAQGSGLWSAGDEMSPPVDPNRMAHNIATSAFNNVPLIRFNNQTGAVNPFDVEGVLRITWDGVDGVGRPTLVDVVIGKQNAAHTSTAVLLSTTLTKPNNFASILDFEDVPVSLEDVLLGPGESIIITHRARNAVAPGGWIHLGDNLTITTIPTPGSAGLLALGTLAALRRRRR
jgi:uncharacterized protein (TIGR03382 family)